MKLKYVVSYKGKKLRPGSDADEPYYFMTRLHADNFVKYVIKEHQDIKDWKVEEVAIGYGKNRN